METEFHSGKGFPGFRAFLFCFSHTFLLFRGFEGAPCAHNTEGLLKALWVPLLHVQADLVGVFWHSRISVNKQIWTNINKYNYYNYNIIIVIIHVYVRYAVYACTSTCTLGCMLLHQCSLLQLTPATDLWSLSSGTAAGSWSTSQVAKGHCFQIG